MAVVERRATAGMTGIGNGARGQNGRRGVASRLTTTERPYAGRSRAERSASRHQRLMDAGLELFGTQGYAATSIGALCRSSRVTPRYFYESFSSREEVLAQLHERLSAQILGSVSRAIADTRGGDARGVAGAACAAFFRSLLADPRIGRIVCVESVGVNDEIEGCRRAQLHQVADALVRVPLSDTDDPDRPDRRTTVVARAVVGGFYDAAVDYMSGAMSISVDDLGTEMALLLLDALHGAAARRPDIPAPRRSGARTRRITASTG